MFLFGEAWFPVVNFLLNDQRNNLSKENHFILYPVIEVAAGPGGFINIYYEYEFQTKTNPTKLL